MVVSFPVFAPESALMADIFDPRLNPASFVSASLMGPVITGLAADPAIARVVLSVPLHVQKRVVILNVIGASQMRQCLAHCEVSLSEGAGLLIKVVIGSVL